jgi:hypothetical protein
LSFNPCILGEQGNKWFTRLSTGGVISLVPVKISPNKFLVKKCVNLRKKKETVYIEKKIHEVTISFI